MSPPLRWKAPLRFDLTSTLLSSGNEAVVYFTKRDLLEENVEPIDHIWQLPEPQKTFRKQQPDGSWKHSGKETVTYPKYHYSLVQTWRVYRLLIGQYEFNKKHEGTSKAAEFLFSCQTPQGDIRGMLANQYATYYTGAILAVLIKAGYENDPRVEKGLNWLLSMRQDDGGWTIPILTHKLDRDTWINLTSHYAEPLELDRSQPFSHNWTDMALRAFAAHPKYRRREEALKTADLLKTRFFQPDVYTSYQDPKYWVTFHFWWPNLVTALDSLSLMGYSKDDPDIKKALDWLVENQAADGCWNLEYAKRKNVAKRENKETKERRLWLTLKIARILKRFY
ncbi:MAG: hypothetical protein NWF00_01750 [Candidatus Bathyarchaeota archaeon]|nr:hypothetical protein [Candidatus Bathyarchaeota archaeon]